MLDRKVRVTGVRSLGAGHYLLTLAAPEQAVLARPGQLLMVKCVEDLDDNPLLRRPFSIFAVSGPSRASSAAGIKILVKDIGVGTHKLVNVKPGQPLFALGPQGRPFELNVEMAAGTAVACLVAGGVGIAALYLLAEKLKALGVTPVLFYGARSAGELVLRDYFERLRIRTIYATEDGSLGERGLVTTPLARFLKAHRREGLRVYACGPWAMMRAVDQWTRRHSVPCDVSLEARMGCSLGACMGCVVRTKGRALARYARVCTEGPVMSSRLIDWAHPPM